MPGNVPSTLELVCNVVKNSTQYAEKVQAVDKTTSVPYHNPTLPEHTRYSFKHSSLVPTPLYTGHLPTICIITLIDQTESAETD